MLWLLFHMLLYNYIIGPMLFQYYCLLLWLLLIFIPKFIFRVMPNVSHLFIFSMCIHLL